MITVVVGKEIEKIKGDFESYLNGLNMVGEISYSQYSKLYDEGTKQIQKAYELGKSELQEENAELKEKLNFSTQYYQGEKAREQLAKAKEIIKEMLSILPKENIEGIYEITEEAEHFLNSEVQRRELSFNHRAQSYVGE